MYTVCPDDEIGAIPLPQADSFRETLQELVNETWNTPEPMPAQGLSQGSSGNWGKKFPKGGPVCGQGDAQEFLDWLIEAVFRASKEGPPGSLVMETFKFCMKRCCRNAL